MNSVVCDSARIEFPFLASLAQVTNGINNFFYEGDRTNIARVLRLARLQLLSP